MAIKTPAEILKLWKLPLVWLLFLKTIYIQPDDYSKLVCVSDDNCKRQSG